MSARLLWAAIVGFVVTSTFIAGCAPQDAPREDVSKKDAPKAVGVARLSSYPRQDYKTDDKNATYDKTTHLLTSPSAHLQVYFPSEPAAVPRAAKENLDHDLQYRYLLPGENFDLMISHCKRPNVWSDESKERGLKLNGYCTEVEHQMHLSQSSMEPIPPLQDQSKEGVEARGRMPKGLSMYRLQVVVSKQGDCFQLMAVGPFDQITSADANKFFSSFKIL